MGVLNYSLCVNKFIAIATKEALSLMISATLPSYTCEVRLAPHHALHVASTSVEIKNVSELHNRTYTSDLAIALNLRNASRLIINFRVLK